MIRSIFMMLTLLLTCSAAWAFEPTPPDTTKGIIDKGKIQVALQNARLKYQNGDTRGALAAYRNVLVDDPNNAVAHYRIAECQNDVENFKSALESLDKAVALKPDVNKESEYLYGLIYHRLNELDQAITHYTAFKTALNNPKKDEEYQVSVYIAQCERAKDRMNNPVDAEVKNIGKIINSRYDEYQPTISPDGQTLYFTGRRPDSKGGQRATDGKYYEDVYFCKWDAATSNWSEPEGVVGKVNTDDWDAISHISPDGQYLYLTQNIFNYTKSADITYTKLTGSGKWGNPKKLGKTINTSYFESSASITGDGETMFFISERAGEGLGRGDIWMAKKISRREWGEPVNLGAVVNSTEDENFVHVHPSGKILFFSSKGHDGIGGYDIFKSELVDGNWTKPVNLGYPINTTADDAHFKITNDGKMGYFTSDRDNGFGDNDIYTVDLEKYPVLKAGMIFRTHGVIAGTVFNNDGQPVACTVEIFDKKSGRKLDEVKTTDKGEFSIELIGNKTYELRVAPEGYGMAREDVELTLLEREDTKIVKDLIVKKK